MQFPCLVYKSHQVFKLVDSDESLASALAAGWFMTPGDALNPPVVEVAPVVEAVADDAPPTRAELEEVAAAKGIKFDGRTSDAKLEKLINEAQ